MTKITVAFHLQKESSKGGAGEYISFSFFLVAWNIEFIAGASAAIWNSRDVSDT